MLNIIKIIQLGKDLLFRPTVAFSIFIGFIILYLVFLDTEGAFTNNFLHFGPDANTKFLNMKLDTWEKVILVYIVGFISSLLTSYYNTTMYDFIHSKIWNPAYTETLDMSKGLAYLIVSLEPLLFWILNTLQFFINFTMRLQFILPQFLGAVIVDIPYAIMKVGENKFSSI